MRSRDHYETFLSKVLIPIQDLELLEDYILERGCRIDRRWPRCSGYFTPTLLIFSIQFVPLNAYVYTGVVIGIIACFSYYAA
jgi:hypothetical protein